MASFFPPMYGVRKGRKIPKAVTEAGEAQAKAEAEAAEKARKKAVRAERAAKKEAEAKKPAKKAAKKKPAKKPAKKAAAKKKPAKKKAPKKKKWSTSDTKEDLYWLGQTLKIDKIKTRTPKPEMIKILRKHPGAEEIK